MMTTGMLGVAAITALLALIGAGLAQLVDDREAAATMHRPEPSRRHASATHA
jgi:hypothetical protein